MGAGWWAAVMFSPRALSLLLPLGLTFAFGTGLFLLAMFSAFLSASVIHGPDLLLGSLIQGFVGGWLMLAPSAARRGSPEHDEALRLVGVMLAAAVGVLVLSLYVRSPHLLALLNVSLMSFGAVLATRYLRSQGR
jgi:hypothetical protein